MSVSIEYIKYVEEPCPRDAEEGKFELEFRVKGIF
jgi:hypothetical protein